MKNFHRRNSHGHHGSKRCELAQHTHSGGSHAFTHTHTSARLHNYISDVIVLKRANKQTPKPINKQWQETHDRTNRIKNTDKPHYWTCKIATMGLLIEGIILVTVARNLAWNFFFFCVPRNIFTIFPERMKVNYYKVQTSESCNHSQFSYFHPGIFVIPLIKLCCGNHKLPIEVGRYRNLPRICTKCDVFVVGDDFHFMFECISKTKIFQTNVFNHSQYITCVDWWLQ